MRLKSLTYTSVARLDLSEDDLNAIHVTSRHLNALDAITGLLLFDGLRFLQIVEGSEEAIDNLLARLRRDPRHSSIEVREERIIEARAFPDWAMEMVRVDAGFKQARTAIGPVLPPEISAKVREIALRMAGELSTPN